MTQDQLQEIPYTVVETSTSRRRNVNPVKVPTNTHVKDRTDRFCWYVVFKT
jgi:hypothetical protein